MAKKTETYADLKEQLDHLLTWFDRDDLDVDEAIAKYEEAIKLTKKLEAYLIEAENKIKKLT